MSQSKGADKSDHAVSQKIAAMNDEMEQRAETGQWQKVTVIMLQRNAVLTQVPAIERSSTYRSAQQSTRRVLTLAETAKSGVTEQLASMQRGRKATDSYRENS